MPSAGRNKRRLSPVSAAFVENRDFLKNFLGRFFSRRQDIEDVVQETYLRAYVAEQKKGIEHPKGYLFRVAKNIALTELTKKSRRITSYLEEAGVSVNIETEASALEEIEAQELLVQYCAAVATLSDKCREVFLLRKVHGLRHKEIQERMSLSESSVAKYLREGILVCDAITRQNSSSNASGSRLQK